MGRNILKKKKDTNTRENNGENMLEMKKGTTHPSIPEAPRRRSVIPNRCAWKQQQTPCVCVCVCGGEREEVRERECVFVVSLVLLFYLLLVLFCV